MSGKYPEHERLALVKEKSQLLGAFLAWLESEGRRIATYHEHTEECDEERRISDAGRWGRNCEMFDARVSGRPVMYTWDPPGRGDRIERILAMYLGIDLEKIRDEKDEMYRELVGQYERTKP